MVDLARVGDFVIGSSLVGPILIDSRSRGGLTSSITLVGARFRIRANNFDSLLGCGIM